MVRPMGEMMQLDVSLMERLYTCNADGVDGVRRTMLDVSASYLASRVWCNAEEF